MLQFVQTNPKSVNNIWTSNIQTIILNTNVEGKMHGIANALFKHDKEVAAKYLLLCAQKKVRLGQPVCIRSTVRNQQFIFFPIKQLSGDAPKADALESCFQALCRNGLKWSVKHIATHKLGCGSSDIYLSWEQTVYPMMKYYFQNAPGNVTIFGASDPTPAPDLIIDVVDSEPVTSVVPSVRPATTPLNPVLAHYALDLDDAAFEEIYGKLPF